MDWYEPYLYDHLENDMDDQRAATQFIFQKYENFEDRLKAMFENRDEVRNVEQQIENLRQRGSATEYATKFQQLVAKTA